MKYHLISVRMAIVILAAARQVSRVYGRTSDGSLPHSCMQNVWSPVILQLQPDANLSVARNTQTGALRDSCLHRYLKSHLLWHCDSLSTPHASQLQPRGLPLSLPHVLLTCSLPAFWRVAACLLSDCRPVPARATQ